VARIARSETVVHTNQDARLIRFGQFDFDPATLELSRRGVRVRIQGQPLRVLAVLLSRRGALVTREALRLALWPEGTYVDFEHGLNAAVRRLRRALNDQADTPRFIETLARRGYRFVALVDRGAHLPRADDVAALELWSRLRKPRPTSALAEREYLKGRHFSSRMTAAGLRRAIVHFERAIDADPRCALAYCGLADCYSLFAFLGLAAPDAVLPKAREAAQTALAIDDELAEAHASLASITKVYEWDWAEAEAGYQRALALNPKYATAHRWYAAHLAAMGRRDESLAAIVRASALDPVSPLIVTELAWNWYMAREFEQALSHAIEALDLQPGFPPACFVLGLACEQLGRYEQALDAFRTAAVQAPNPAVLASEAHLLAAMGRRDEAVIRRARLEELVRGQYVPPYWFAIVAAGFEDLPGGLAWLERGFAQHDVWLVWLKNDPRLDPFRADARFQRLLEQIGLTPDTLMSSGRLHLAAV